MTQPLHRVGLDIWQSRTRAVTTVNTIGGNFGENDTLLAGEKEATDFLLIGPLFGT